MILYLDKLAKHDLGGFTTDLRKAEYILAFGKLTFAKILEKTPKTTELPSGMFSAGKYVVSFNISWDLSKVIVMLINYQTDLDKHFDVFADSMSPKTVEGFHKLREKIKLKDQNKLNSVSLSDNNLDFEIAYQNYNKFYSHQ
jgi:hypothetical protein